MEVAPGGVYRAEVHPDCGHPSVARLLEELLRLDRGTARTLVAQARLLIAPDPDLLHPDAADPEPDLPATAEAAGDGDLDPAHIGVVAATMTRLRGVGSDPSAVAAGVVGPLPEPVLDEVERHLAALARERGPRQLDDAAAEIADRYDPDGAAPHDTERPTEEVHLNINRNGVCTGRFRFVDPDTAQSIVEEITARTPPPDPDDQTTALRPGTDLAARRGEGLRHLLDDARRTRHHDEESGDPDQVTCADCADGGVTDDDSTGGSTNDDREGATLGLVDDVGLRDPDRQPPPDSGGSRRDRPARDTTMIVTVPLDLLERRLHATGGHPGGELGLLDGRYRLTAETARRMACDAGIIPALLGSRGEMLLCTPHHQQIHHSPWSIVMSGGSPTFIPPAYLDPQRRPRTNGVHRSRVAA